ncbi:MAG: hypothetical protein R2844_08860 [Caldilineales bacterium]
MLPVRVLESRLRRAPLGLRFMDLAQGVAVSDGLEVLAWPLGLQHERRSAVRSPLSGIYGYRALPGLRLFEVGQQPASFWCTPGGGSPPQPIELPGLERPLAPDFDGPVPNFALRVDDRNGRFLSLSLLLCLPKESLVEVPLFSSPSRPALSGQGVLRGQVWDAVNDRPAAWALVTAAPDNTTSYATLADARGVFALFLPYASTLPPLMGSPPHGGDDLRWELTIRVHFEPDGQLRLIGQEPPDLRSLLEQASAQVHDRTGVIDDHIVRLLYLGQELQVVTENLDPPNRMRLLVNPV